MLGEVFYLTGGSPLFLFFKVIHRMFFDPPFMIGGFMMLWGYLKPLVLRKKQLVSREEADFYKQLLNSRIYNKVGEYLFTRGH
jgi:hypothetical protein